MKQKTILFSVLALIIITGGAYITKPHWNKKTDDIPKSAQTFTVPITTRDNPSDEEITFTTSTIQEDHYQVSLTAPQDFPEEIQKEVDEFFSAQKEAFLDIANDPQMTDGTPYPFTLSSDNSEIFRYGQFTSYVTQFDQYTGGAHGNTYFYTIVYDSTTGKKLELADLFKEPAHAYAYISEKARPLVIAEVLRNSGIRNPSDEERAVVAMMAEEGTAPREENFSFWYLDNGKLMLIFPPYQVASYAAGTQIVGIPMNEMMDVLDSEVLTSVE